MWNLLAQGSQSTVYKPTAYDDTASISVNPTYAYDVDEYPFATQATISASGSPSDGVAKDCEVIYKTFSTLSKANFSSLNLLIACQPITTLSYVSALYAVTSSILVQYSADAGSTWTTITSYNSGYRAGGVAIFPGYPARAIAGAGLSAVSVYATNGNISLTIPASALSVGLQSLQIKIITSTISKTGVQDSAASLYVQDIRAVVS